MMAVLRSYDTRLDLAAQSLGAKPWQVLRHVTFPILAAGLFSALLFAFATSFDELTIALFSSDAELVGVFVVGAVALATFLPGR